MSKKKFSGKQLFKGLFVGGLLGGTTALLFAPRSGKETKELITKEVDDSIKLITDVKNSAEDVQFHAANLQHLSETMVPEFLEDTHKALNKFDFKAKHRIEDIKKQLEKINTEVENLTNELDE